MQERKDSLTNGHYYHIFTRSIAGFVVFNNKNEFLRICDMINLYQYKDFAYRYGKFLELKTETQAAIRLGLIGSQKYVEIIAYCVMPTHLHLILKQNSTEGVSRFMSKLLNSYSRYFNIRHKRIGPLWSGRFKNVLVRGDEQLLHLTRYIHLNPTSANIVDKPEEWEFSSYREYIGELIGNSSICETGELFEISSKQYKKFVDDRKRYQQDLSVIKSALIDNYTG